MADIFDQIHAQQSQPSPADTGLSSTGPTRIGISGSGAGDGSGYGGSVTGDPETDSLASKAQTAVQQPVDVSKLPGPRIDASGGDIFDQIHAQNQSPKTPGFLSNLWHEAVVNPARQVAAGFEGASAATDHLTANVFDLLDKAADGIASVTGTNKVAALKQIADWARGASAQQEQQAQRLSGGRTDLPSQLYRGVTQGVASLPTAAIAADVGGPVAGFAALGAVQESDKGWPDALKAAAEGALTGGALTVMGPASRPVRLAGAAAMTYAQARLNGADNATAIAHATTMGVFAGGPGSPEGGATLRDMAGNIPRPTIKSTLNPTQQVAVDYLQDQGANLPLGTLTGNKFVQGVQKLAATSPMGAGVAADAARTTEGALQRTAGSLAAQASPTPATPESAGAAAGAKLDSNIAGLKLQEDAAYSGAWQGADDPANTVSVPVKTMQRPITDNVGRATGKTESVPVMANVQAPVDVRGIKQQLQPVYDSLQWMPASDRASSAGYQAVSNILKGPDFIPAQAAEQGRSGLLTMGRVDNPNLRNTSQGMAAGIIPDLTEGINAAVAKLGPDNLASLQKGRATHATKMDVADLADKLRDEPVQAFNQLTWKNDTGIDFLRKIQGQAPDVLPQVGRAYIQKLFDTATQEGGFSHSQSISNQWDNLGRETKKLLYPNPALRASLDKFFLGAKMVADNPNPSGTALVAQTSSLATGIAGSIGLSLYAPHLGLPALAGEGLYVLGGRAVAKLLYSPAGVRLLTGGLKPENPGAAALRASQILRIAGDDDVTPIPPGGSPPSTPPSGGARMGQSADDYRGSGAPMPPGDQPPLQGPPNPNIPPGLDKAANPRAWMRPNAAWQSPASNDAIGIEGPAAPAPSAATSPTTGTQTSIPVSNDSGRTYQANYKLRELADLQTSHNGLTFGPNENYGLVNDRDYTKPENQAKVFNGATPAKFDPRRLINTNPDATEGPPPVDEQGNTIGGNGRGMILQRVAALNPAGMQAYRDLLTQNASHFGIDPADVGRMKQPVLTREIADSEFTGGKTKQTAVTDFNDDATAELRPSERAVADSRRVSQSTLDYIGGSLDARGPQATLADVMASKDGVEVLQRMIQDGAINSQEVAAYAAKGDLTPAGKARINQALLGRFFRDPMQVDTTPPEIRNRLARIAPSLTKVENDPAWTLTPTVQGALDLLEASRAHGLPNLDDAVNQVGLLGAQEYTPRVVALAKQLQSAKPTELAQAMRTYAQDARFASEGKNGIFGAAPTPDEAFDAAFPQK